MATSARFQTTKSGHRRLLARVQYLALGMLYLRDNRYCANHSPSNTSSNVWLDIGAPTPAEFRVGPPESSHQEVRPERDVHRRPRTTALRDAGQCVSRGTVLRGVSDKSEDEDGLRKFFKQFSFPGGIGSHCTPETPGSIHEGGGTRGTACRTRLARPFDNPDLLVDGGHRRRRSRDRDR
jgi:xylulose-5-phosphate/fructose-6-phosphate phosphoketolase